MGLAIEPFFASHLARTDPHCRVQHLNLVARVSSQVVIVVKMMYSRIAPTKVLLTSYNLSLSYLLLSPMILQASLGQGGRRQGRAPATLSPCELYHTPIYVYVFVCPATTQVDSLGPTDFVKGPLSFRRSQLMKKSRRAQSLGASSPSHASAAQKAHV